MHIVLKNGFEVPPYPAKPLAIDLALIVRTLASQRSASRLSSRIEGYESQGQARVLGLHPFSLRGGRAFIGNQFAQGAAAEITAQAGGVAMAIPLEGETAIGHARDVLIRLPPAPVSVRVTDQWLGRVFDPLLRPLDGGGILPSGDVPYPIYALPPAPGRRRALGPRMNTGVRAINLFATCRMGQKIGIFAGSGVGKSSLLSMILRQAEYDVSIIALIGERGREVREFVENQLGCNALRQAIVIVATSDTSAMIRRDAAYTAMAVAEAFRDRDRSVLLLIDSITRYCVALREIGLRSGEPPASRGYPPGVFSELARLMERAGPGLTSSSPRGSITAFFNVLVEGDDLTEPVSDAARGILDGHIILDRRIGEAGRYPAVDVLRSLSRTTSGCNSEEDNTLVNQAREALSISASLEALRGLGAYQKGADPRVDSTLQIAMMLNKFLQQSIHEGCDPVTDFRGLATVLSSREM